VLLTDDYTERANRAQLDRAIAPYRDALAVPEPVERRVVERQSDLALALRDRFKDAGSGGDLDEAIAYAKEAADATPPASVAWAGYTNNYANALAERFEADGELTDLETAIELFRAVLHTARDRPTEASGYATNLSLGLATLAGQMGREALFDEALRELDRAVELLPAGHPDLAARIANLADVQRQQAEDAWRRGDQSAALELADLSIDAAQRAVAAAGASEARLLPALASLARAMRWLHSVDPEGILAAEVLSVQRRSASLTRVSPAERFGQSALRAEDARRVGDP
jgi:tetratricopeptide (TPR) repeat protein